MAGYKRFNAALEILNKAKYVDNTKTAAIGYCFGGGIVLNMKQIWHGPLC